jgi:hypothetical protein
MKDQRMSEPRGAVAAKSRPEARVASHKPEAERELGARLGVDAETVIGRRLKAMYDDVLREPVPDRFRELLDRLEQAGNADAKDSGEER